ncbi:MAG: tyrosine-type recombinase/integrase family protein [Magnetococcales bacterium]|nr:tyrosine-type recombinase/integrase family protein [Magnetococcales bacterium]
MLQYLEGVKRGCANSTWKDYKSAIHYHLIPAFGQILLRNLTTAQIRAWLTNLEIGNKRINNILVPLRGMLKDAHADGFIDRNPMDRIRNLHVTIEDPAPFTPEEMTAILDALIDYPQARNMIQFAFWTGLRTSELLAIEWGDIDWKRGMAVIRRANVRGHHKEPKTQSSARDILLLPDAVNALLDQKKYSFLEGGAYFAIPGTAFPGSTTTKSAAWFGNQHLNALASSIETSTRQGIPTHPCCFPLEKIPCGLPNKWATRIGR